MFVKGLGVFEGKKGEKKVSLKNIVIIMANIVEIVMSYKVDFVVIF